MCAVTAAQLIDSEDTTIEECAKQISDIYRRRGYIDDGYENDIAIAAHAVVRFIKSAFPDKKVTSAIRQLQYCIKTFHPSGKKKFFLQGAIFNQQKTPLTNRVASCIADVMVFHVGTLSGTFPLAPKGWTL